MQQPIRLTDRLLTLRGRSAELENRVQDEMAMSAPDGLRLQTLARLTRQSKDQILLISQQISANDGPNFPSAA